MSWIQTYSGLKFYPLDPRPDDVRLDDIAHALSLVCRFGGHCLFHYSVAQHSVYVSRKCSPRLALYGLLHDAAEAYLGDVVRPVKRSAAMKPFYEAEERLFLVIAGALHLEAGDPFDCYAVKEVDARMLMTERRDVLGHQVQWGDAQGTPAEPFGDLRVDRWTPEQAERQFIAQYWEARKHVPA